MFFVQRMISIKLSALRYWRERRRARCLLHIVANRQRGWFLCSVIPMRLWASLTWVCDVCCCPAVRLMFCASFGAYFLRSMIGYRTAVGSPMETFVLCRSHVDPNNILTYCRAVEPVMISCHPRRALSRPLQRTPTGGL